MLTCVPVSCLMVVIGSRQWPLLKLDNYGLISADGQSCHNPTRNSNDTLIGGLGGGSGGTILLFLQALSLAENSSLSALGGYGGALGGGGGGGGRIHFHWTKIAAGEEYIPLAFVNGAINYRYANVYDIAWIHNFILVLTISVLASNNASIFFKIVVHFLVGESLNININWLTLFSYK